VTRSKKHDISGKLRIWPIWLGNKRSRLRSRLRWMRRAGQRGFFLYAYEDSVLSQIAISDPEVSSTANRLTMHTRTRTVRFYSFSMSASFRVCPVDVRSTFAYSRRLGLLLELAGKFERFTRSLALQNSIFDLPPFVYPDILALYSISE